jgi:arylsulfatase
MSAGRADAAEAPPRPNIIVLLVDDMGFSDIGCYGSEIPTPNLDRLAADGLRFTQFYNTARCCPTRASLLTGLYSHQAGMGHMTEDRGEDGYRGDLNDRCVTIAEVLGRAGYRTGMTGKWHVTKFVNPTDEAKKFNWPLQRGFQRYFGIIQGGADYFQPKPLTEDNRLVQPGKGFYTTDAFVEHAIRFIDQRPPSGGADTGHNYASVEPATPPAGQGPGTVPIFAGTLAHRGGSPVHGVAKMGLSPSGDAQPFFLYVAFNAPHFPLMAPQEDIDRFRGRYLIGWDQLRLERHARQIKQGIVDGAWRLSPRPAPVRAWETLYPDEQDRFDHIMAIYAAVVAHMDRAVGRLVDALRERKLLDNTLILFLSDNGANAESGPNGRLEGERPGATGSTVFEGQSWATLSNTPLRRYKHYNHEGGIATPLIVHWPARVKTPGALRKQPGHVIDIMATCLDVAGASYPAEFKGKPIEPMEGKSLLPAFDDRPIQRDAIYWEHEGNAAIRVGDWKLVRLGRGGPWELYNLAADRTELHDLAAAKPQLVRELAAKWDAWAQRTHVKPYPREPEGKPARKLEREPGRKGAGRSASPLPPGEG